MRAAAAAAAEATKEEKRRIYAEAQRQREEEEQREKEKREREANRRQEEEEERKRKEEMAREEEEYQKQRREDAARRLAEYEQLIRQNEQNKKALEEAQGKQEAARRQAETTAAAQRQQAEALQIAKAQREDRMNQNRAALTQQVPGMQKQWVAERLLPKIRGIYNKLAFPEEDLRIMEVLLEMDNNPLLEMLESDEVLKAQAGPAKELVNKPEYQAKIAERKKGEEKVKEQRKMYEIWERQGKIIRSSLEGTVGEVWTKSQNKKGTKTEVIMAMMKLCKALAEDPTFWKLLAVQKVHQEDEAGHNDFLKRWCVARRKVLKNLQVEWLTAHTKSKRREWEKQPYPDFEKAIEAIYRMLGTVSIEDLAGLQMKWAEEKAPLREDLAEVAEGALWTLKQWINKERSVTKMSTRLYEGVKKKVVGDDLAHRKWYAVL